MKNETKRDFGTTAPFTMAALEALKKKGVRYVQIKGFTSDKRLDYMEPRYMVLIPMMDLPVGAGEIEIYESINSKLLQEWATHFGDGFKVLISLEKKKLAKE
jgi:hypothetical protein